MPAFTKVTVFLRDEENHVDYNRRILDYHKDRHKAINDSKFSIAIEVVYRSNPNAYVLGGMASVPALRVVKEENCIYGVNSILATLVKLEIVGAAEGSRPQKTKPAVKAPVKDWFFDMALQEMRSNEQEDDSTLSTVRPHHADTPDTPPNTKTIEEKTREIVKIYEDRKRRNGQRPSSAAASSRATGPPETVAWSRRFPAKIDVESVSVMGLLSLII